MFFVRWRGSLNSKHNERSQNDMTESENFNLTDYYYYYHWLAGWTFKPQTANIA